MGLGTVDAGAGAEAELRALDLQLDRAGIAHVVIVEEDGPHAGQVMAIGIEPVTDRAPVRKVVSRLPLLR